ncbi:IS1 family transposase [soil metagenome]
MANILSDEKQATIISALAEGNSIRSIERMTGVHRDTIMRLGLKVGEACAVLMDKKMQNLTCSRIEVDEIWGFIGKKQANVRATDNKLEMGDVWTYLAIDPVTKLMPAFVVGKRDMYHTRVFMDDLASRMANRIQLSSDAMNAYAGAVERAFGADIDYGQIVKEYSSPVAEERRKYSPAKLKAVSREAINGDPVSSLVSTSMIERANLTVRTHCKRLARLTLAFSKKKENFTAAIALHLAYYNFVKFHGSLRMTPAMAAGIETSAWTVKDLVNAAK